MNKLVTTLLIFGVALGISIFVLSPTTSEGYGRATAFPLIVAAIYYFTQKPTTA